MKKQPQKEAINSKKAKEELAMDNNNSTTTLPLSFECVANVKCPPLDQLSPSLLHSNTTSTAPCFSASTEHQCSTFTFEDDHEDHNQILIAQTTGPYNNQCQITLLRRPDFDGVCANYDVRTNDENDSSSVPPPTSSDVVAPLAESQNNDYENNINNSEHRKRKQPSTSTFNEREESSSSKKRHNFLHSACLPPNITPSLHWDYIFQKCIKFPTKKDSSSSITSLSFVPPATYQLRKEEPTTNDPILFLLTKDGSLFYTVISTSDVQTNITAIEFQILHQKYRNYAVLDRSRLADMNFISIANGIDDCKDDERKHQASRMNTNTTTSIHSRHNNGITMIVAGAMSLYPPMILYIPYIDCDVNGVQPLLPATVHATDVLGLDDIISPITSLQIHHKSTLDNNVWSGLQSIIYQHQEQEHKKNDTNSTNSNSVALVGFQDGSVYITLISTPTIHTTHHLQSLSLLSSSPQNQYLNASPACKLYKMHQPMQAIISMHFASDKCHHHHRKQLLILIGSMCGVAILKPKRKETVLSNTEKNTFCICYTNFSSKDIRSIQSSALLPIEPRFGNELMKMINNKCTNSNDPDYHSTALYMMVTDRNFMTFIAQISIHENPSSRNDHNTCSKSLMDLSHVYPSAKCLSSKIGIYHKIKTIKGYSDENTHKLCFIAVTRQNSALIICSHGIHPADGQKRITSASSSLTTAKTTAVSTSVNKNEVMQLLSTLDNLKQREGIGTQHVSNPHHYQHFVDVAQQQRKNISLLSSLLHKQETGNDRNKSGPLVEDQVDMGDCTIHNFQDIVSDVAAESMTNMSPPCHKDLESSFMSSFFFHQKRNSEWHEGCTVNIDCMEVQKVHSENIGIITTDNKCFNHISCDDQSEQSIEKKLKCYTKLLKNRQNKNCVESLCEMESSSLLLGSGNLLIFVRKLRKMNGECGSLTMDKDVRWR